MARPNSAPSADGEFDVIERLSRLVEAHQGPPPADELWIGDDAAVLRSRPGSLLVTTDMAVAGVHADLRLVTAADLGWRALAAAVSDVAAMGGRPTAAVVAVGAPPGSDLDDLYLGLAQAAAATGCPVVGGDLTTCPRLVVCVTVTGTVESGPPPVRRSGARPGQAICVTGPLGAAAAGLRRLRAGPPAEPDPSLAAHLRPVPRLEEGELARRCGVTAMIDVSDGLVADLGHVADASRVGFEIAGVPVADGATAGEALSGGDDYELVMVTDDPRSLLSAFARGGLRPPAVIGKCTGDHGRRLVDGGPAPEPGGWVHDLSGPG